MKNLVIFLFITGLHNKPYGCGASVASAAGPFSTHTQKNQAGKDEASCNAFLQIHVISNPEEHTCNYNFSKFLPPTSLRNTQRRIT
jgi:hypothetical protein